MEAAHQVQATFIVRSLLRKLTVHHVSQMKMRQGLKVSDPSELRAPLLVYPQQG